MSSKEIIAEKRDVSDFTQVIIKEHHEGELIIEQGRRESLTIEAPRDIMSRISTKVEDGKLFITTSGSFVQKVQDFFDTSLSRGKIKYILSVKRLFNLEITGIMYATIGSLKTRNLAIKFNGAGRVNFDSITTDILDVRLTNVGSINLVGNVNEQLVTITGSGSYQAPDLLSKKAKIVMKGVGSATVWVEETLDVEVVGVGTVSYYGSPQVRSKIAPVGNLKHLGKHD
ncbi:MAG: hypothetical protein GF308_09250 [Candidatus Heimdallarchaeota archaeon]|nr:hypothetical protein [Candidatus Heimdallarchaeota archaeon]